MLAVPNYCPVLYGPGHDLQEGWIHNCFVDCEWAERAVIALTFLLVLKKTGNDICLFSISRNLHPLSLPSKGGMMLASTLGVLGCILPMFPQLAYVWDHKIRVISPGHRHFHLLYACKLDECYRPQKDTNTSAIHVP